MRPFYEGSMDNQLGSALQTLVAETVFNSTVGPLRERIEAASYALRAALHNTRQPVESRLVTVMMRVRNEVKRHYV